MSNQAETDKTKKNLIINMSAQHECPVYISAINSQFAKCKFTEKCNVNQDYFSNDVLQKQCILIHVYTVQKVNAILYVYTL